MWYAIAPILLLMWSFSPNQPGEFYLIVFETPDPFHSEIKIPKEVKLHLRALSKEQIEWWIIESPHISGAEKLLKALQNSTRMPMSLEAHRIRISQPPFFEIGTKLSGLRYRLLDYGIKMIKPRDDGYWLIDRLADQGVEGVWMMTDQFEGFFLSQSHEAKSLEELSEQDIQVKNKEISYRVIDLVVVQSGTQ